MTSCVASLLRGDLVYHSHCLFLSWSSRPLRSNSPKMLFVISSCSTSIFELLWLGQGRAWVVPTSCREVETTKQNQSFQKTHWQPYVVDCGHELLESSSTYVMHVVQHYTATQIVSNLPRFCQTGSEDSSELLSIPAKGCLRQL